MTHWEVSNLLTDYSEGALDRARAAQMEEHLASCEECRAMLEDVQFALRTLRAAEDVEPSPWLVRRILRATIGERKPQWGERLPGWMQWALRPQVVYTVSMAVFSLSFILYTSRVNLQAVELRKLNPTTWVYRADSRGHLLVARAEKFYYDLRFVYELESILRQLKQQPSSQPGSPQSSQKPGGGSSDIQSSGGGQLALEYRQNAPTIRFQETMWERVRRSLIP